MYSGGGGKLDVSEVDAGVSCINSRSGPRTSLGPVTLTVGVVLGPVWGPVH